MFGLTTLIRAIRRRSITFAVVFAGIALGAPVHRWLRDAFGNLPLDGLLIWLLPFVVIALLARYEDRWLPNAKLRSNLAWLVVITAIALRWWLKRLAEG